MRQELARPEIQTTARIGRPDANDIVSVSATLNRSENMWTVVVGFEYRDKDDQPVSIFGQDSARVQFEVADVGRPPNGVEIRDGIRQALAAKGWQNVP